MPEEEDGAVEGWKLWVREEPWCWHWIDGGFCHDCLCCGEKVIGSNMGWWGWNLPLLPPGSRTLDSYSIPQPLSPLEDENSKTNLGAMVRMKHENVRLVQRTRWSLAASVGLETFFNHLPLSQPNPGWEWVGRGLASSGSSGCGRGEGPLPLYTQQSRFSPQASGLGKCRSRVLKSPLCWMKLLWGPH